MRLSAALALFLLGTLPGCHVVERSKQCQRLAHAVKTAAPELEAAKIPDSPTAKQLRRRARIYGQLGTKIEEVLVRDPKVKKEQMNYVSHLQTLEKQFIEAATAVENQKKFEKRQEEIRAKAARKPQPPAIPPASEPAETGPTKAPPSTKAPHPLRKPGPPTKKKVVPPPAAQRSTVQSRRYGRAKRSIEATGAGLKTVQGRLEKACR